MFQPYTERIKTLAIKEQTRIEELDNLFSGKTNVYIDYANIRPWSNKLAWHIDLKRLKQLFNSFNQISEINFYYGTDSHDAQSVELINQTKQHGYRVHTKPVKEMRLSIDESSIPINSPAILSQFIRSSLLKLLRINTIEMLNKELTLLNSQGVKYVVDKKCNFDVEIGRDMLVDFHNNNIDTFILMSGDSDFAGPVEQLLRDKKKVILFATVRRISTELDALTKSGLIIFDIQKIRQFICWPRELSQTP